MTAHLTSAVGAVEGYRAWSATYDEEPNALLHLEERYLAPLLPRARTIDIADLGCGTGRWLEHFADSTSGRLFGVDASVEMLAVARRKIGTRATLLRGDCTRPPLPENSADLVLSSFVAGYLPDLDRLAASAARIVRADGNVFLTDMHPETAVRLGWKRAYRLGERRVELSWRPWSLFEILVAFRRYGFEPVCLLEPRFGEAERPIFAAAGRPELFAAAAADPAIYVLQFRRSAPAPAMAPLALRAGRIAIGPGEAAPGTIEIAGERVHSILPASHRARIPALDLTGCLVLPGLFNAHDHLEFGLFPRLGRGPYCSAKQWADDIHRHDAPEIARQRAIPPAIRLWWGALRNLLCGVTTVCHHNKLNPELLADDFPVHVVKNFGWAHSLAFDSAIREKFVATPAGAPFLIHLGEGVGDESREELYELDRQGAIGPQTVLVHGLALDGGAVALLNQRGAALVWCPTSNQFLYGSHLSAVRIHDLERVALGTDSPLTAAGDLLDEMRFAHDVVGVPAAALYCQVTANSADLFGLPAGTGALLPGACADLVAVRDTGSSPCDRICQATYRDVELVMLGGRVQLASDDMHRRLPETLSSGLSPLLVDGLLRWVRAPLGKLFAGAEAHLGCDVLLGGRRVEHVSSAWL